MSEPPVVTDAAVRAGTKAFHALALEVPCREDRDFAVAVLDAAVPHLALAAGAAAGEYIQQREARVAVLEAALTDVLTRFVTTSSGRTARVSGTVLARWQAVADGTQDGGPDGG